MKLFDFFKPKKKIKSLKSEIIDGLEVRYRKHHFSRSIRISLKSDGSVLVTLPRYAPYIEARDFVLTKMDWIKKNIKKKEEKTDDIERIRKIAKNVLPKRLEELASEHGFKYGHVSIRNQRTRYGSCSFQNNINLNMNLVNLPQKYIDYVILHELCHTIEKNHSKKFWELLEKHCPNALQTRRELKKIHL